MARSLKPFLPLLLVVLAAAAALGALSIFRTTLYYPSLQIRAPGDVEFAFLFNGRRNKASCERLTTNVANTVLAVCRDCTTTEKRCLESLEPRHRQLLSTEPLDVASARLPDGGVVTYQARDPKAALAVCRESERQASARMDVGRVVCYPPGAVRHLAAARDQLFGLSRHALGLLLVAIGALALGMAGYLISRYEQLQDYFRSLPRSVKRLIMVGLDIVLLPAALLTALVVQHGGDWAQTDNLILMLLLSALIAIPVFMRLGMYRAVIRYLELRMALTVVISVTIAVLLFAGLLYLLGISGLEVEDAVVYWLVALLYTGGSRLAAREYLRQTSDTGAARDRAIIYGAGDAGAQLAMSLRSSSDLTVVAFVDDSPDLAGSVLYGIRVHPARQLPSLVKELGARQILLAMPSASRMRRKEIFDNAEALGLRIRTIPRLSDLIGGRASIDDIEDVGIEDLFGRDPVPPIPSLLVKCIEGKSVLVTGAGGSIGSELCRQILALAPKKLVLLEMSEYALYAIQEELLARKRQYAFTIEIVAVLASAGRRDLLRRIIAQHEVRTIYHAAAYKHVPLVEANPLEAIRNNVIGSLRCAEAALAERVETFVLVSTDKAVRPANIMGASKRMAELIMQAMVGNGTRFCMVRFGNVLDSSGSVVPLFRRQIQEGGPVTVTHPDITRYFMTIPEAAQLVLQAGAMAKGGDVFVLDMGSPVKILDLARRMVRLSGFTVRDDQHPDGDIEVRFSGLRPGEKLYEEPLVDDNVSRTEHPLILRAMEEPLPWARLKPLLDSMEEAITRLDAAKAVSILLSAVPVSAPTEPLHDAGAETSDRRPPPLKLVT